MRALLMLAAGAALVAAAPVKLAPADDTPPAPVGAAARAKHGPDPMAKPAADVGAAEDPVGAPPVVPAHTDGASPKS